MSRRKQPRALSLESEFADSDRKGKRRIIKSDEEEDDEYDNYHHPPPRAGTLEHALGALEEEDEEWEVKLFFCLTDTHTIISGVRGGGNEWNVMLALVVLFINSTEQQVSVAPQYTTTQGPPYG